MDNTMKVFNTINDFFEVQKLYLDNSKCDYNYYSYELDPNKITHDDVINDSLQERIRRFNMSTYHLTFAVERMLLFWNALNSKGNNQESSIFNYRLNCRDVCINIDMYVDKIKAFCRYYFYMSEKVIDDSKEWAKTLKLFTDLCPTLLNTFLSECSKLMSNDDYKFVHNIRNDEIHNESALDLKKLRFSDDTSDGLKIVDDGYKLQDDIIIEKIQKVLLILSSVRDALQEIVDKIHPHKIATYVSDNEAKLKNVIKCDKRYIATREAAKKYGVS